MVPAKKTFEIDVVDVTLNAIETYTRELVQGQDWS